MDASKYYNFGPLLSYNGAWNFVTGGRGIGKSYGAKEMAVRKAITKGRQFIYLRRYREELKTAANTFFADIIDAFPGATFRRAGWEAQYTYDPEPTNNKDKQKWHTMGYFIALSQMQNNKSVAFPNVDLIIYDEYIAEKGRRYLPGNEVDIMLAFYDTVDRGSDRVRVLFLANSVSINNPYYNYFSIEPDGREFIRLKDGFIVCQFPEMDDFNNERVSTRWGRFIAGTAYGEYSINNVFHDNHEALIRRKHADARPLYNIDTSRGIFSLWYHTVTGEFFAQEKLPKDVPTYAIELTDVREGVVYLPIRDAKLEFPKRAFRNGRMLFDKPSTRNTFLKVFK